MGSKLVCLVLEAALYSKFLDVSPGNEISKVEGLESLQDLRELVLDRNKIKGLSEYSFMNQWNLVELHMEENRLRELSHFQYLENLQRLYLGSNRLQVLFNKLFKLLFVQSTPLIRGSPDWPVFLVFPSSSCYLNS